jgi:hypothetical protein
MRKAASIFVAGRPPMVLTIVGGAPEMTVGMAGTLAARGFTASRVEGVEVFSTGEDFKLDLKSRDPADPFADGMGKAQRLAVTPGRVVSAAGTGIVRKAHFALARPDSLPKLRTLDLLCRRALHHAHRKPGTATNCAVPPVSKLECTRLVRHT